MESKAPLVELRGIRKAFGSCVANEDVNLSVEGGTIHAIVGENGAGKSTAMRILYGQFAPDQGSILLQGKAREWSSPADAVAAGIGMVHQHFMLAGPHTVLENILLGVQRWPFSPLGMRAARKKLESLMREYGLEAPLDALVEEIPVGIQQRVEILKLLYRDSNVLILDEPTAVLTPAEVEAFFRILRGMAGRGKTILLITHKLKEVMAIADRVTVFRAGKAVAERTIAETNVKELAELMVGRALAAGESGVRPAPRVESVLVLDGLRARNPNSRLQSATLRVRAGEIVGIAGVEGNGQGELLEAILFRDARGEGRIEVLGKDARDLDADQLRGIGVAILPQDRQAEALALDWSLRENFLLGRHEKFRSGFFLQLERARQEAERVLTEYDVRPARLEIPARGFSGGNQQKFVVGREMSDGPKFLLAAQPTRGVDVGAIEFIHGKLLDARANGLGILLVSSELEELMALSDRILVMFRGRFVAEFARGDFDEKRIGYCMTSGVAP